jgi:transcriptional regulator
MSTQGARGRLKDDRPVLMQGTLDVLVLRTLLFGPEHGQGIARAIQQTSGGEFLVEHGALYPALQRLEAGRLVSAKWGTSSNNRRARYYTLTRRGREHLTRQSSRWRRLAAAMARVLGPEPERG